MKKIVPLLGLFVLALPIHAQNYTAKNLGTLGGTYSKANGINNSGRVVGDAYATGSSVSRATLFSGTGTGNVDLGTLGGLSSSAKAINDAGLVVGSASSGSISLPTLFKGPGGSNYYLGGISTGYYVGTAYGINNAGKIVGDSSSLADGYPAVAFSGSGVGNVNLKNISGSTASGEANAISASGVIVGRSYNGSNARATKFSGTGLGNVDLGSLGGPSSAAYGINASNQIVGSANTVAGFGHAALFSNVGSNPVDLGTLGGNSSTAYAINKSGVIVGESENSSGDSIAFIYRGGKMVDLNSLIPAGSGLVIVSAKGINDAGQIAATVIVGGQTRAFRLDPIITYVITAKASPSSKGSVKGAKTYVKGTTVTLTAKAKKGKVFTNWTEAGKVVSKKKVYQFKAEKSRSLVAHFKNGTKATLLLEP